MMLATPKTLTAESMPVATRHLIHALANNLALPFGAAARSS
jgi:hypothetical protein